MRRVYLAMGWCVLTALSGFAQDESNDPAALESIILQQQQQFEESLEYLSGEQIVGDGIATLRLQDDLRFFAAGDARRVLEEGWGNPPDASVLGMLVPTSVGLFDDDVWVVVVSFEEDGYVDDEDAADIDYDDLLESMREGSQESNEWRVSQGYPAIDVVGWATKPRYDSTEKKLYWAKELAFEGSDENTLNYNIRALGRRGVLVLNAIASMSQLQEIEAATPGILGLVDFNDGHRYSDFDPSIDKVAAYGIGGLIAGKIALKAGLFKVIALFFAKFWKDVLIAGAGLVAVLAKVFKGRKADESA